jgi:hypothetical protein
MATCIVRKLDTDEVVNFIIAEPTDIPQDGCYLTAIPDGYYWDNDTQSILEKPISIIDVITE